LASRIPMEIQQQVISQTNPCGWTTNSDLEMTGLLLQWIVLVQFTSLEHAHVACLCKNTPTMAWATKATNATHLLRNPCPTHDCLPGIAAHLPRVSKTMADFASCSFDLFPNTQHFLTKFYQCFPLPQQASWICCHLPNKTVGHVLSTMSMPTSGLVSWWQLKQCATITGSTGPSSF